MLQQRLAFMGQIKRWGQPCAVWIGVDSQASAERSGLIMAGRRADPRAAAAEVVRLHRMGRGMVEQWMRGTSQTLASAAASTS